MTLTAQVKKSCDTPAQSPEKIALRAAIADPAHSPYEPRPELFGRSPVQFALFGARGEDLGDGPFAYERSEGFADLLAMLPRLKHEPASADHRRQRFAARAVLSDLAA